MTGQQLKPMGPLDFEELIDVYKEQIRYITEAGADLLGGNDDEPAGIESGASLRQKRRVRTFRSW